ncbi:MAG: hypothetical protein LQ343_002355 [Gyalolechia ehrenbergii]|nr:MAG: hypothetical protein LQ343_002355 [Gyalolechia ehrenbergii]
MTANLPTNYQISPFALSFNSRAAQPKAVTMISDNDLYTLAVFLGCLSMLLIILYHFLEVNAIDDSATATGAAGKVAHKGTQGTATSGTERGKGSTRVPSQNSTN